MKLYKELAKYYDLMFKQDYDKEALVIKKIIDSLDVKGKSLLDVGCGTGGHMVELKKLDYKVSGLDSSQEMINEAVKKLPKASFYNNEMQLMNLEKTFDVITILNRTLLFAKNKKELKKLIKNTHNQLRLGGAIIMDLDMHEKFFDIDKSETAYFNEKGVEGSLTEEYDLRGKKILWSVNLSINDKNELRRLIDNQEFLLINIKKLIKLMKAIGFKTSVYTMTGEPTGDYKQGLIIVGIKLKKKKLSLLEKIKKILKR